MRIHLREELPFIRATLVYRSRKLDLKEVLIDTDSAGSVFSADKVASIGLAAEPYDTIRQIRGVGGFEFVFVRRIDSLVLGDLEVRDFEVEQVLFSKPHTRRAEKGRVHGEDLYVAYGQTEAGR